MKDLRDCPCQVVEATGFEAENEEKNLGNKGFFGACFSRLKSHFWGTVLYEQNTAYSLETKLKK